MIFKINNSIQSVRGVMFAIPQQSMTLDQEEETTVSSSTQQLLALVSYHLFLSS